MHVDILTGRQKHNAHLKVKRTLEVVNSIDASLSRSRIERLDKNRVRRAKLKIISRYAIQPINNTHARCSLVNSKIISQ